MQAGAESKALAEADELVCKAVAGDEGAMTRLLAHFGPEVERSLSIGREWRSVVEPADVMQVTYLEAYLQIARFDPGRSQPFSAWLRRIAENNLRDAVRGLQRQKRPPPSGRIGAGAAGSTISDLVALLGIVSTTPSRHAAREERASRLMLALEALPDDYSRALKLYDIEALPIAEVAKRMNRSPGAVHMLRARAIDCLRTMLGSDSDWFSSSA